MKKITVLALALLMIFGAATAVSASWLGAAGDVLSKDCVLIKSGILGKKLSFSDSDFKSALALTSIGRVTVVKLPSPEEGVLYLDGRAVIEGQTVRRRSIGSLYFMPKDDTVTESSFVFKVSGASDTECVCRMRFLPSINYAPKVSEGTETSLTVTTQRGISVYGRIGASDPEGDAVEVMMISYPKGGALTLDGYEFKYTPSADFSGDDSFVFVLRDEYGNYSKPTKVKLNITERLSEVVYVDMLESKSYNAAVALTAMGLMNGKVVGNDKYFMPEDTVSRAEFCAMAMMAVGVRPDSTLTATYFDDNADISPSLVGYVATAARCGIVNGSFEDGKLIFRPNDAITATEAAIIMSNLLNVKSESSVYSSVSGIETVPVYARAEVGAMYERGIFDSYLDIDMNAPLTKESAAEYLYRLMK